MTGEVPPSGMEMPMTHEKPSVTQPRAVLVAGAVAAALLYSPFSGVLLRPMMTGPVFQTPYLATALINLSDLVVMAVLLCLAAGVAPGRLIGLSGLTQPIRKPLLWAAILFVPALATAAILTEPATNYSVPDLFWQGVGIPVIEELVYRGLAVAALIRWAGWHWLPACLLPAVFFGAVHMGQGSEWIEIAGIVAITGVGGVLFGWLFARWDFNLWPPILLHVGLNCLWIIFDLGVNALGGMLGNGLRVAVVGGAIALTFVMAPRPDTAPR